MSGYSRFRSGKEEPRLFVQGDPPVTELHQINSEELNTLYTGGENGSLVKVLSWLVALMPGEVLFFFSQGRFPFHGEHSVIIDTLYCFASFFSSVAAFALFFVKTRREEVYLKIRSRLNK